MKQFPPGFKNLIVRLSLVPGKKVWRAVESLVVVGQPCYLKPADRFGGVFKIVRLDLLQ